MFVEYYILEVENRVLKKYEVFISSTYEDLKKDRKIVQKAILSMNCFPAGMELFPATDRSQFEYICEIINECDYYILILGGSLGSICKETKKSYTQMEYEYAKNKGIPVIAFVKVDKNGQPLKLEKNPKRVKKYEEFLNSVQNGRLRKGYKKKYELFGYVQQSLQEEMRLHPREGWIRDVSPLIVGEDLLLKGRLLYSFLIDKRIYDVQDMYDKIPPVDRNDIGEKFIKYGIDTQGAFKLILVYNNAPPINLFYEVDNEYFDDEGILKADYKIQISLGKMGNIDEILLFFCAGNSTTEMDTKIYSMSDVEIKRIAQIKGQESMYLDYSLIVNYGSQGLFDSYVYLDGTIHSVGDLDFDIV